MNNVLLLNPDELWLRGKNRPLYLETLSKQVRSIGKAIHRGTFHLTKENQRLIFWPQEPLSKDLIAALSHLPGIFTLEESWRCEGDTEELEKTLLKEACKFSSQGPLSFRIRSKRAFKEYPLTSMELDRKMGEVVTRHFPKWKVDLKHPDVTFSIKVASPHSVYISSRKIPGVGGLPLGTSGKLLTLLSGGFDGPVASYLMAARGCHQDFIFFHAYPFVGDEAKEKALRLTQHLSRYQLKCHLHVVPFGKAQEVLAKKAATAYRTLLFRYTMILVANGVAAREGHDALCTGDSLGQVSSQTLENMSLLDKASTRPILRPLLGLSKRSILEWAKKIGSYSLSALPHNDSCALFAPPRPVIRPHKTYWQKITQELGEDRGFMEAIQEALEKTEKHPFSPFAR